MRTELRDMPLVAHPKGDLVHSAVKLVSRLALRHGNRRAIFKNPDDIALLSDSGMVHREDIVLIHGSDFDVDRIKPSFMPAGKPVVVVMARLL